MAPHYPRDEIEEIESTASRLKRIHHACFYGLMATIIVAIIHVLTPVWSFVVTSLIGLHGLLWLEITNRKMRGVGFLFEKMNNGGTFDCVIEVYLYLYCGVYPFLFNIMVNGPDFEWVVECRDRGYWIPTLKNRKEHMIRKLSGKH